MLSPTSARSEICAWEVGEAARLGKRILPVNCRPLEGAIPPPRLRDLNYIFFYADPKVLDSGFGTGLLSLVEALNTDFDWLREHTRYLQRATEWDRGGRPANRLLSGDDIAEAKAWVARRPKNAPEPTALHLDFIRTSEEEAEARSSAQRKQLEEIAAAQVEREKALHEAEEALKQAADALRRRARIRNIAFVVVSIFVVLAGGLFWIAEQQRKLADELTTNATVNLGINYLRDGPVQDYARARMFFEDAADKGNAFAMLNLGLLYYKGKGVAQDYAKAREWYEKAANKGSAGSAYAKVLLEQLPITEAARAGRYAEALQRQEAYAAKVEEEETKRAGRADEETAQGLRDVARYALFTREFTKALAVADRAHALLPDELGIESNRAHALMFLGRGEEAKALYLIYKGKPIPDQKGKLWERAIAEDFAEFRKAGLTHPMMADIEKELGVLP